MGRWRQRLPSRPLATSNAASQCSRLRPPANSPLRSVSALKEALSNSRSLITIADESALLWLLSAAGLSIAHRPGDPLLRQVKLEDSFAHWKRVSH
jgi:hypothetical protein